MSPRSLPPLNPSGAASGQETTGQGHIGLASVMNLCARDCRASLPDPQLVRILWSSANTFHIPTLVDEDSWMPHHVQSFTACSNLVTSMLELLAAVLPRISADTNSNQTSNVNSTADSRSAVAHGRAAAASRAARVLQQRRLAEEQRRLAESVQLGPHTADLIHLLAGTMQVMDTVCRFLATQFPSTTLLKLLREGNMFQTMLTVTSFLLRCVRHQSQALAEAKAQVPTPGQGNVQASLQSPQQAQAQAQGCASTLVASKHLQLVLTAACQNVCYATSSMFSASLVLEASDLSEIIGHIPDRFFDTLGCLACESLEPNGDAAWEVARVPKRSLLSQLSERQSSSLLCCPAMRLLTRRIVAYEILGREGGPTVEVLLGIIEQHHPEVALNHLLPQKCRPRLNLDTLVSTAERVSLLEQENSDEYYFPHVDDDSLQQFTNSLPKRSSAAFTKEDGRLRCASLDSVHLARLTAVLLSVQRPHKNGIKGLPLLAAVSRKDRLGLPVGDIILQPSLQTVAGYTLALSTQLLQGLRCKHLHCEVIPVKGDPGNAGAEGPRYQFQCMSCLALAEGMTATLLQVLRLHQPYDQAQGEMASVLALDFSLSQAVMAMITEGDGGSRVAFRSGQPTSIHVVFQVCAAIC